MPPPTPIPSLVPFFFFEDDPPLQKAAKKAAFFGVASVVAFQIKPKAPAIAEAITHAFTGFEIKRGAGVIIKPGFALMAAPEPLGLNPPALTGLPPGTGRLESFYSPTAAQRNLINDAYARRKRDLEASFTALYRNQELLDSKSTEELQQLLDANREQARRIGPPPEVTIVLRERQFGDVDTRTFLEVRDLVLSREIEIRTGVLPPEAGIDWWPRRDGGTLGIDDPEPVPGPLGEVLGTIGTPDSFFAVNAPDP